MQNELLQFIGDVYDASIRPENWDTVMAGLCLLTRAKSAVLVVEDQRTSVRRIIGSHGIRRILSLAYNAGLGKYDNTFSLIQTPKLDVTLLSSQDLKNNIPTYYQFILKPADIGHISVADLYQDDNIRLGLAVHRSTSEAPFSDTEADVMRQIAPHVCRAAVIQREIAHARREAQQVKSLLHNVPVGMVVVDGSGRIRFSNLLADHILLRHKALSLNNGCLKLFSREYQRQFDRAIAELSRAGGLRSSSALDETRIISLSHPNYAYPLVLFLTLQQSETAGAEDTFDVVVRISDPGSITDISLAQLEDIFALSAAEAEVAVCLVNGLKLSDIAEYKGVSTETVRTQVKNIFHKLGVSKQQEVIRVILQALIPLQTSPENYLSE